MRISAVLAALLILMPLSSQAEDVRSLDGNLLVESCSTDSPSENTFLSGFCVGFISGIGTFIQLEKEAFPDRWPQICIPYSVPAGQMRAVFLKYIEDHPEELHFLGTVLAISAFREAFPCNDPS